MKGMPAIQGRLTADIISESLRNPLAVAFSRSGSPNYGAAVELAKLGIKYAEQVVGKSVVHMAVFAGDRLHMSRALALLRYIKSWKGTQLYAGGKLLFSASRVEDVISCFLTACACNDYRAHCHRIIRSPFAGTDERIRWVSNDLSISGFARVGGQLVVTEPKIERFDRYVLPCRFLARYGELHFRLDGSPNVSPGDRLQAMAASQDCAWCPNFRPSEFEKTQRERT